MAPPKPRVDVDLGDGQTRKLSFDMAAAWEFEEQTGRSTSELGDAESLSAKDTVWLVTAMLREDDPEVTPEHVARHLHMANMGEVTTKLNEVMAASADSDDGEEGNENPSG
jgi:hypothetical protein